MSKSKKGLERALSAVGKERRQVVKQLVGASAFAVPLTLTASLDGSAIREARAQQQSGGDGGAQQSGAPGGGDQNSVIQAPEPSTLALLGGGVAVMLYLRKRGLRAQND